MDYERFISQLRRQAQWETNEEALQTVRTTLETLGERVQPDEAKDLAAQLPREHQQF